jgi:hypothetical protein
MPSLLCDLFVEKATGSTCWKVKGISGVDFAVALFNRQGGYRASGDVAFASIDRKTR